MPEGWRPRGITPRPRAGAAAESARLRRCWRSGAAARRRHPESEVRGGDREELPHVRGQWRPGGHTATEIMGGDPEELPRARGQGRRLGGATSHPRPGAVTLRSHPEPKARARGREEQPK